MGVCEGVHHLPSRRAYMLASVPIVQYMSVERERSSWLHKEGQACGMGGMGRQQADEKHERMER